MASLHLPVRRHDVLESVRRHFVDLLTDDQLDGLGDATEKIVQHLRALPHEPQ